MKPGDLVRIKEETGMMAQYNLACGVVLREDKPVNYYRTGKRWVVLWSNNQMLPMYEDLMYVVQRVN